MLGEKMSMDTMLKVALELFWVLNKFNMDSGHNFKLRVGIAHGPVVAGNYLMLLYNQE
jgi:class 3 adenylate cyclase